jgi:hypothetical protein
MDIVVTKTSDKHSKFENEYDLGKAAVWDWTINYNKKHVGKMSINSLHKESIFVCLHNC